MRRIIEALPMTASYFKLVLQLVGITPARRAALLEGTGFDSAAAERIGEEVRTGQLLRLLRNASDLTPAGWGLSVGARLQSATHGFVGFGAVSAPALGAALEVVERFTSVRNPSLEASRERKGEAFRLVLSPRCELLEGERLPLVETYFLSLQAVVESVLAGPAEGGRLELMGCPQHAPLYRDFFRLELRFDAERDALVLPAALLERRSPLADPEIFEISIRRLEEMGEQLYGGRQVATRAGQLLASGGDAGLPMEKVAKLVGVSPRTLTRRLAESGVSYRELRDSHRRRCAERLLARTDLGMGEIALRLGYDDVSNFARACRRWFGCAPRNAREHLRLRPLAPAAAADAK